MADADPEVRPHARIPQHHPGGAARPNMGAGRTITLLSFAGSMSCLLPTFTINCDRSKDTFDMGILALDM